MPQRPDHELNFLIASPTAYRRTTRPVNYKLLYKYNSYEHLCVILHVHARSNILLSMNMNEWMNESTLEIPIDSHHVVCLVLMLSDRV